MRGTWRSQAKWGLRVLAILAYALASFSSGCLFTATPEPSLTQVSETPQALQTSTPTLSPTATPVPSGAPRTLTVWITEKVAPLEGGEQAEVLARQIAAFEATHPGLEIELLHKKSQGKGDIEDLLTTASAVAPDVVPDLVALDTEILPRVARQGLTVPLDGLLPAALQADLYPFALKAGTVDEQWMGVQFETEGIEHAIYNPNKIALPPLTWSDVFSSGATYIFPAAGQGGLVNDAFLIQYLSTGAELIDGSGNPALDPQALAEVLEFYQQGIERGAILTDVLEYATVEQCWPKYLQAEVVMSNISSDLYLSVMTGQVTAVPTRDGQAIALSRGYAWALTARDPDRLSLAVKLLKWLMNPLNMATWSQAARYLPTRRAAFEQMERDPYVAFMYAQLETTIPYPTSEIHRRIYQAMQQAIDAVLREGVPPESAVQEILQVVNEETSL